MTRIGGNRTGANIPLSDLQGTKIPEGEAKVVSTKSHDIQLETLTNDWKLPDFKLTQRNIEDPDRRASIIDVPASELAGISTGADFKAKLGELLDANKAYLQPNKQALLDSLPEGSRSNFAFNNISGRRTEQFFDEAMSLIGRTGLRGSEATTARKAVNLAHRDAFRGRAVDYDRADTGSYWSYGHDAPFAHVFEKMLDAMPEDDPKRPFIQNQLDFIFTHKYADSGKVNENDAEKTMGLVAIDKASRNVVSMVKSTEDSNTVQYETLKVPDDAGGANAGRSVYRDGDKHFFAGTREAVPADLVNSLEHSPASEVVFRRKESGETLRNDFRFNWRADQIFETVDAGWWGHCDIKATMETLLTDMAGSRGVKEFNSASGKTVDFSRADQLEALAALLNFDDHYLISGGGQAKLGNTAFAGGRFDDRPSAMTLKTSRGSMNLSVKLSGLSEKGDSGSTVELDRIFSTKLPDARNESFKDNPDILRVDQREKDTTFIDATGRKISGKTEGYSFSSSGRLVEENKTFTLDPNADSGDKQMIGSELVDVRSRTLNRYYYDPATKEISKVRTQFKEEGGSFKANEGTPEAVGKLNGVELGREMTKGDDVKAKLAMLDEAVRSGDKMATDSDLREQVWNGEVHRVRMDTEWRSDDGKWERVGIHVDATFGSGKVGSVLHKLDDEGKIAESLELKAVVDFFWKDRPRVASLANESGKWHINGAMYERGVLSLDGDDMMTSLSALRDLNDLIYLGLKTTDNKQLYTIVHEGTRLVYEDESAWRADVERLKGGDTPPPPPPPVGDRVKVERQPGLDIPDNAPAGIQDTAHVDARGALEDIKIDVDLKHTYVGDLTMTLVAPDGTEVALHKKGGGGRDDIKGTYGGDLTSAESLDALLGKEINGDWQLKVVDSAGQDVGKLVSWALDLKASGDAPPPPGPQPIHATRSPNADVPDNDPNGLTDTVRVDSDHHVTDLQVELDLKHTWIGDLTISLVAPDGTEVKLHDKGGSSDDDIKGTYGDGLDPVESFDAFRGLEAGGDWKLKVVDAAGQDVGKLVSWGLKIDTE